MTFKNHTHTERDREREREIIIYSIQKYCNIKLRRVPSPKQWTNQTCFHGSSLVYPTRTLWHCFATFWWSLCEIRVHCYMHVHFWLSFSTFCMIRYICMFHDAIIISVTYMYIRNFCFNYKRVHCCIVIWRNKLSACRTWTTPDTSTERLRRLLKLCSIVQSEKKLNSTSSQLFQSVHCTRMRTVIIQNSSW